MTKDNDLFEPPQLLLPDDPHNRFWMELAGSNQHLVDQFRPALVSFIAFNKNRTLSSGDPKQADNMVGTGFIIAGSPEQRTGIVLTAKHVFEGVHSVQTPRQRHNPSTPSFLIPSKYTQPSLDPKRLQVLWSGTENAGSMNTIWASYNNSSDIAAAIIMPQQEDPLPFHPTAIPIDTITPSVGEIVHLVSIDNMSAKEIATPVDRSGKGQALRLYRRISIRRGTITSVNPEGYRQYKWPCFTTTIPITGGMSGGFAYIPRDDGTTISACGVISADLDPHETKTDQTKCGISVIASTWPALALQLPDQVPAPEGVPTLSLLEMAQQGRITMPTGGIEKFRIEPLENGDFRLHIR